MIYKFIKKHRSTFPVKKMCQLFKVSGSGYYGWLERPESKRRIENNKLLEEITVIHRNNKKRYGSPRIHQELIGNGFQCSENKVARIMTANEIKAVFKKKYYITTDSRHDHPIAPNLLNRDFTAQKPNQKWVSDITYIPTNEGWLFLCTIIDLYSRKVVGWAMNKSIKTSIVTDAFLMAVINRKPNHGTLFHSDRGVQYASKDFRNILKLYGMKQSMSRKGNCWDNACAETFFKTLKLELTNRTQYKNRQEAKTDIFEYIETYYNLKRRHSTIGYKSPVSYEIENT